MHNRLLPLHYILIAELSAAVLLKGVLHTTVHEQFFLDYDVFQNDHVQYFASKTKSGLWLSCSLAKG